MGSLNFTPDMVIELINKTLCSFFQLAMDNYEKEIQHKLLTT